MATLYDDLGAPTGADLADLRSAYRRRLRELHPDHTGRDDAAVRDALQRVRHAWEVLSDSSRRADYDRSLTPRTAAASDGAAGPAPRDAPWTRLTRKQQWFLGLTVQMRRLGTEAATSAAQHLGMRRRGHSVAVYRALIPGIVDHLCADTEERVLAARSHGTAPLDLGLAATLIGVRSLAHEVAAEARREGPTERHLATAEMLDRMWDTLAHPLRHQLVQDLGGNPHLHRFLLGR